MLVQANDDKNVVKLIAIKGDRFGIPMVLDGNAASKSLNSFNWKAFSGLPKGFNVANSAASAGSGHLILGSKNGDIAFGEVNTKGEKIGNRKLSLWTEFFDSDQGIIGNIDFRRGETSMMALSPYFHEDSYIIGASMFAVKSSRNHGSSWSKVMGLNHVTSDCGHLENCSKCRSQAKEVQYPVNEDLGALCITCKGGFSKNVLSRNVPEQARYHAHATQCVRDDKRTVYIRNQQ